MLGQVRQIIRPHNGHEPAREDHTAPIPQIGSRGLAADQAVSAADLVAAAIATGLGLNTSAGRLVTDLESFLRPRRLLLALDNFEQARRRRRC